MPRLSDYTSYADEPDEAKSHQEGFWVGYERPAHPDRLFDGPNVWPEGHDTELSTSLDPVNDHVTPGLLRRA